MIGGEGQAGVVRDLEDGLDKALAEGGLADDEGTIVILEGARDDLSCGRSVAIDKDDDGVFRSLLAAGGAVDLIGEGPALLRDDDLTALEELVAHVDGFVEEAARISAEVEDEALQRCSLLELVEGVADFAAGGFHELGDMHVADAGLDQEGEIDGVAGDLVANKVKDHKLVGAFTANCDLNVSVPGAFEEGRDGGRVHAEGRLAIDGDDDIPGTEAGLVGRGALKGREDDDLGGAVLVGLGLNTHAHAVVFAVLIFAHLSEGLGIVKVGMRIQGVEHGRNGAVVDGLIRFVAGELFGVVLLDDGVDVSEVVEGVAKGVLVGGGLSGDALADQGAGDGTGSKEDGCGEKGATSAGCHGYWMTSGRARCACLRAMKERSATRQIFGRSIALQGEQSGPTKVGSPDRLAGRGMTQLECWHWLLTAVTEVGPGGGTNACWRLTVNEMRELVRMSAGCRVRRVWIGGVMAAALTVPVSSQSPRYQSPYSGGQQAAPAQSQPATLPSPAPITPNGAVVEDVVVRVNDQIISRSDVERSQQQLQQEIQQQNLPASEAEQRQKDMLRDMIDQQLLLSKAKELGLNADAEVIRRLDEIRKQNHLDTMEDLEKSARQQGVNFEDFKANIRNNVLTQQVVRDEVGRRLQPTQGAEQAYYTAHQQEFEQPEQVRLSEILIPTPAEAAEAQVAQAQAKAAMLDEKLKAGADFAVLAKENSGGQTASTGGDLGLYKRGGLAKVIEDQTFPLKVGQATAPIRTRQGYVILKVTERQEAGIPPLKQVEPQIQEALYMQQMQPALRTYLTKLREDASVDVKPGFVDSGASPRQTKFVYTAYSAPVPKKKKIAQKARFDRAHGIAPPTAANGMTPLPAGVSPSVVDRRVSGATPLPGTTAAVAVATNTPATGTAGISTAAAGPTGTNKVRLVSTTKSGKQKKIRREKVRFGQAPRTALPAGPEEVASGTDVGAGAQSAAVTPGGTMENLGKPNQGGEVAPGVAMAPTEVATEISPTSDVDPLAPKPVNNGKTRFSARDKEFRAEKAASKQAKVKERIAATPAGPGVEEAATQNAQAAPLGLNGDTKKKIKPKKVKGAPKERLQEKKPDAAPAPVDPTVSPNLHVTPADTATPTPRADGGTTSPPAGTPPGGSSPNGQSLSPTAVPTPQPDGAPTPQP